MSLEVFTNPSPQYQEGRQRSMLLKPLQERGIDIRYQSGPATQRKEAEQVVQSYIGRVGDNDEGKVLSTFLGDLWLPST